MENVDADEITLTPSKDPNFKWEESLNIVRWLRGTDDKPSPQWQPLQVSRPVQTDSRDQFEKLSEAILKRDKHQCRRCGGKDRISVHHIIPREVGGESHPRNLITLCKTCHDWADTNTVMSWQELTSVPADDEETLARAEKERAIIGSIRKARNKKAIAQEIGVHIDTLYKWLKSNEIPKRTMEELEKIEKQLDKCVLCIG